MEILTNANECTKKKYLLKLVVSSWYLMIFGSMIVSKYYCVLSNLISNKWLCVLKKFCKIFIIDSFLFKICFKLCTRMLMFSCLNCTIDDLVGIRPTPRYCIVYCKADGQTKLVTYTCIVCSHQTRGPYLNLLRRLNFQRFVHRWSTHT